MSYPETTLRTLEQVTDLVAAVGLDPAALELIVAEALDEDLGGRGVLTPGEFAPIDVTSVATIEPDATTTAKFVARSSGTVAGVPVAAYVVAVVAAEAGPFAVHLRVADGSQVSTGETLMTVEANTRALLRAERVALNLVTMMSGVATATRAWVEMLAPGGTQLRDSRKTTPGLRMVQKYAVRVAGGVNHRLCLADAALIKDNHVIARGGVVAAYEAVRAAFPELGVQVEVTSIEQARDVVAAGARDLLLDNMTDSAMTEVVAEMGDHVTLEASGGLNLARAARVAATGVHYVAVGAITHSAPILDIALDFTTGPTFRQ